MDIPLHVPGGPEYTRMAVRVAGLTAEARALNLSISYNLAGITVARAAGCQVLAVSQLAERQRLAREVASQSGVDGLVRFELRDPQRLTFPPDSFDFIVAEGGALRGLFDNPQAGVVRLLPSLAPGGVLAMSDLVYTLSPPPDVVRDRFPHLWTERKYTNMLEAQGLTIEFACWVARRGWRAFIAASGEARDFWESRDARSGLACLYVVARK